MVPAGCGVSAVIVLQARGMLGNNLGVGTREQNKQGVESFSNYSDTQSILDVQRPASGSQRGSIFLFCAHIHGESKPQQHRSSHSLLSSATKLWPVVLPVSVLNAVWDDLALESVCLHLNHK